MDREAPTMVARKQREGGDHFFLYQHLFHPHPQLCPRPTIIPVDEPLWKLTNQSSDVLN